MCLKYLASFTKWTSVFCYFFIEFVGQILNLNLLVGNRQLHQSLLELQQHVLFAWYWEFFGGDATWEPKKEEKKVWAISVFCYHYFQKTCHLLISIGVLHSLFIVTTGKLLLYSTFCKQNANIQFKIHLQWERIYVNIWACPNYCLTVQIQLSYLSTFKASKFGLP